MSELPYMPFYDGDFLRKTAHLSFDERSAYFWLLVLMWNHAGKIPDNDKDNARAIGLTLRRWRTIKPRILPFLTILPGNELTQETLQKVYSKSKLKLEKRRASGRLGGRPKTIKNNDLKKPNGKAKRKRSQSIARGNPDPSTRKISNSVPSSSAQGDPDDDPGDGLNGSGVHADPLYTEREIAALKVSYPDLDIAARLAKLIPWAVSKWNRPSEQKRRIASTLRREAETFELAEGIVEPCDSPPSSALIANLRQRGWTH